MSLYIPIRKIEESRRLIYGIAAAEEVDRLNEIFDYQSSKPYITQWSEEQAAQSGGKNYGNIRAMHNDIAAGMVVQPIDFDDAKKLVRVCAKIVDDAEWNKVLAGAYTGLSFGGHYVKRWPDSSTTATRYTLRPCELSLADRPCVPSAGIIDVVKTDGSIRKLQLKRRKQMTESKVQKMDITEFGKLIGDVNAGLAEDENAPQPLKDAVANLAEVLSTCTDDEEKTDNPTNAAPGKDASKESPDPASTDIQDVTDSAGKDNGGCDQEDTEKACTPKDVEKIVGDAVAKAIAPMAQALQKISQAQKLDKIEERLSKVEKAAAPSRIVLKTDGVKMAGQQDDASSRILAKIKQENSSQHSWAYR